MGRNTGYGLVIERTLIPALRGMGYTVAQQSRVGNRLGGGAHNVDILVNDCVLVSVKYQRVGGTAEQKVPFEVMCLEDAMIHNNGSFTGAFVVLAGNGWKLKEFYRSGGLRPFLKHGDIVRIVTLDEFLDLVGRKDLPVKNDRA